ncbi:MAG: hypothetical protein ACLU92_03300 [Coprococcus comes]
MVKIIQSLLKKYLSCMESNSKNNRKIWMMQQMQKDGLMFAKKLMLSTGNNGEVNRKMKIENTIQNYFWSGAGRIEVKYLYSYPVLGIINMDIKSSRIMNMYRSRWEEQ